MGLSQAQPERTTGGNHPVGPPPAGTGVRVQVWLRLRDAGWVCTSAVLEFSPSSSSEYAAFLASLGGVQERIPFMDFMDNTHVGDDEADFSL